MDFIENINENWDVKYEEIGDIGDPVFMLIDIDNDAQHKFYPEDLQKLTEFLTVIKDNPKLNISKDLNESYDLYYGSYCGEYLLTIKDIDIDERFNFYIEDIKKISGFLSRLKEFGVLKI